ncbi:S8 family serine peptidase [Tahibacter amnicola]|uniref:S8 family serine peptidase n=1 Tax=Tahibacter amnicola TaxID=2976241 RepID=A0ABY6BBA2_9GAMM|nr:S8 family serine peptidase [Tahibacter amnicola]UXI66433.1 S8 family serine peptidase [Tahibacter amnicola]
MILPLFTLRRWLLLGALLAPGLLPAQPRPGLVTLPDRPTLAPSLSAGDEALCPRPRTPHVKPDRVRFWPGLYRDRVVVKLRDGGRLYGGDGARAATFAASSPMAGVIGMQIDELNRLLADRAVRGVRPYFSDPPSRLAALHEQAQARSCRQMPRLDSYYWIYLDPSVQGEAIATRLNQSPLVEVAYLPPFPRNADVPPQTPDFESGQGYLRPAADGGIDAVSAWELAGGRGAGMRIIDIEGNWNVDHEDLPKPFWYSGVPFLNEILSGVNAGDLKTHHGTSVVSELVAKDDGHGVTGIASDASWGAASTISPNALRAVLGGGSAIHDASVADAVIRATEPLRPGDVILIEQHSPGPPVGAACSCRGDGEDCRQFEFVPMEYFPDSFDAISTATAAGIIVVEAAGNGEMDLDRAEYENRFDRTRRDSGAILVGATVGGRRERACFSNHGGRVDVNGWGSGVMAAGHVDREGDDSDVNIRVNGSDVNQFYTRAFGGTSSASPIVAGAVLSIQGVMNASGHGVLTPEQMRRLLVETSNAGGALVGAGIGGRPDLRRALADFDSVTIAVGGSGGSPFQLRCPQGQLLVGVRGRAGLFIDQLQAVCAFADGSDSSTASVGGTGGEAFARRCQDGRVVVGMRGRSGAFVDQLQLECAPSADPEDRRTTDTAGGEFGAVFGPVRCPEGRLAAGFKGRAGAYIDQLQLLCTTKPADATVDTPWTSRAVGGNGGVATTTKCGRGEVMAGVFVRSGAVIDAIAPRCVKTTAGGRWDGTPSNATVVGGSGGTATRLTCARDQAVSAISGRAGALVDRLRVRCSPLASASTVTDTSSLLGGAGGNGGAEFGRIECPARLAATGFAVRRGGVVDQLKLICGR